MRQLYVLYASVILLEHSVNFLFLDYPVNPKPMDLFIYCLIIS